MEFNSINQYHQFIEKPRRLSDQVRDLIRLGQ